jgi:hypothetical protein
MTTLSERFERLGLSQYLEVFTAEGFDTWETVLDITEPDLYVNTAFDMLFPEDSVSNPRSVLF